MITDYKITAYTKNLSHDLTWGLPLLPENKEELTHRFLTANPKALHAAKELAEFINTLSAKNPIEKNPVCLRVVGGFVRDAIMGRPAKDLDIEVYGITHEDLLENLKEKYAEKLDVVGKSFQLIKIILSQDLEIDLSIPRAGKPEERIDLDSGDPELTPVQAALIRDFTMNNFAADPLTGEVFDYVNAIQDIKSGQLKATVDEHFEHNPMYLLRASQFCARHLLFPDKRTFSILENMNRKFSLDELHPKRVTEEFNKLLLKAEFPSIGLELMRLLGILQKNFPELPTQEATAEKNNNSDPWSRTLLLVDTCARKTRENNLSKNKSLMVMLAALCSQIGNGEEEDDKIEKQLEFFNRLAWQKHIPAAAINCNINTDSLINLYDAVGKEFLSYSKAPQTKAAGKTRIGPARISPMINRQKTPEKIYLQELRKMMHSIYPSAYQSYFTYLESLQECGLSDREIFNKKIADKAAEIITGNSLHKSIAQSLISKDCLKERYEIPPGPEVGVIIGLIEKERYSLITRQRAEKYLESNLEHLKDQARKIVAHNEASRAELNLD